MHPRPGVLLRDCHPVRYLCVGEVVHGTEPKGAALGLGKVADRSVQHLPRRRVRKLLGWLRHFYGPVSLDGLLEASLAHPSYMEIHADVCQDPPDPGLYLQLAVDLRQGTSRAKEGLLDRLLGVGVASQRALRLGEQALVAGGDQLSEWQELGTGVLGAAVMCGDLGGRRVLLACGSHSRSSRSVAVPPVPTEIVYAASQDSTPGKAPDGARTR